jgi:DNA replication and repair protein RecF
LLIKRLKLKNFRNYENLDIDFANNFNIIYGQNAQGKTNILEAVFLCATGRSHRTSRDTELIRLGSEDYYIKLDMEKENRSACIEVDYGKKQKKRVRINEVPQKRLGSLIGHLNAVIFSPEDLLIIKEGPSERRRFLDMTISQIKPSYFHDLQQYSKILLQRNMLLKEIEKNKKLLDTLDIWNKNLIKVGSRIIKIRSEFLNKISKKVETNHRKLTNCSEILSLKYLSSISLGENSELSNIEAAFEESLKVLHRKEILKGVTLCGPQRDDYDILLNGMSIKVFGSQGQQRTAVLSLKLSEIDIMKEDTDEYPVLLLDDVMSELDSSRQQYLFSNLEEIQTFITCTDRDFFDDKVKFDYKFLNVIKGKVIEK